MAKGRKPGIIPAAIQLLDTGFAGDADECALEIWHELNAGWRWQARWKQIREGAAKQGKYAGVAQIGPRRKYLMISNEEQAMEHMELMIRDLVAQFRAKIPQMTRAAQTFPNTANKLTQPSLTNTRQYVLESQIEMAPNGSPEKVVYSAEKSFSESMNGDL